MPDTTLLLLTAATAARDSWPVTEVKPVVLPLAEVDRGIHPLVGGKGANLGEMTQAGLPVPSGFCITTSAYKRVAEEAHIESLIDELAQTSANSIDSLAALAREIRNRIEATAIPTGIANAVAVAYGQLGESAPVAVRSSATAEDLPGASFAGQQDTYLNLIGVDAVLAAVRRCWASLWTDRAVIYRAQNQIEQQSVQLAVVVQPIVPAEISGILFTADPVTGDRAVCLIDASYGLGEALVSGHVNADEYRLRKHTGELLEANIRDKTIAVWPLPGGGAQERHWQADRQRAVAEELDERRGEVLHPRRLSQPVDVIERGNARAVEDVAGADARPRLIAVEPRRYARQVHHTHRHRRDRQQRDDDQLGACVAQPRAHDAERWKRSDRAPDHASVALVNYGHARSIGTARRNGAQNT